MMEDTFDIAIEFVHVDYAVDGTRTLIAEAALVKQQPLS